MSAARFDPSPQPAAHDGTPRGHIEYGRLLMRERPRELRDFIDVDLPDPHAARRADSTTLSARSAESRGRACTPRVRSGLHRDCPVPRQEGIAFRSAPERGVSRSSARLTPGSGGSTGRAARHLIPSRLRRAGSRSSPLSELAQDRPIAVDALNAAQREAQPRQRPARGLDDLPSRVSTTCRVERQPIGAAPPDLPSGRA